jgi:hypothetical protein
VGGSFDGGWSGPRVDVANRNKSSRPRRTSPRPEKKPDIDRAWRDGHQALASAAPHRRLVVADGSDHDVPEERPEAIVQAVPSLTAQLTGSDAR